MASTFTKEQLKNLPITPYNKVRKNLNSGDLFFSSGNYWVSRAIQKFTSSPWSHVGIIFKIESLDRILLLESVEDMGVRFAPLSKYLHQYENSRGYKGEIVIARIDDFEPSSINVLAKHGIDELTRPYDKDEIAKIVSRIALGRGKWKRDREYICSELVFECFEKTGNLFQIDKRGFISPENIWQDPNVNLINRIH